MADGSGVRTQHDDRALLDAVDAPVLIVRNDAITLEANESFCRQSGYARGDLLGKPIWQVLRDPHEWPEAEATWARLVGTFPATFEREYCGRHGARLRIRWSGRRLDEERLVLSGSEISEIRQVERTVQDQLRLLQTLLDTIPSPIFYKAVDGRYLGCNRAFAEYLGKPPEEIVGKDVYELTPNPALASVYEARDRELFDNPGVQIYDSQVRYADGSLHDVTFFKASYTDSEGKLAGLVGVILDITPRKEAERALEESRSALEKRVKERTAELEAMKEAAEDADRAKSEFLNIASHELRTPLTSLRLALQRAERALAAGSTVDAEQLHRMQRYTKRLVRMATDLLEVSRLERGLLVIHPQPLELRGLLEAVVDDFRVFTPARRIELRLPETPLPIQGDADRLAQVLGNLVDNALKYSDASAPVEVEAEVRDGWAVVRVHDYGPGIPADRRAQLFSRFYRVESALHQPGLGLGLFISRDLVERHGGALRLDSEPGSGTTLTLQLPLSAA